MPQQFDGTWSFEDLARGEMMENSIFFELGPTHVRALIGGTLLLGEPVTLESTTPSVVRMFNAIVRTARVEAYKQRKITAVPKPTSRKAPLRDQQQARSGGPCRWCGGSGEYEGKDGCWVECQHCQPFPAGDDED